MMSEQETDPIDDDIIEDDESMEDAEDDILSDDDIVDEIDALEASDADDEEEFESELDLSDEDENELALESNEADDYEEEEYPSDDEEEFEPELYLSEDDKVVNFPAQMATADELDIDAALAAVSQLTLLTQDEPDDDISEGEYYLVEEDGITEFTRQASTQEPRFEFEQPHELSMLRGQMASVIPALSLIILGGWLTFTLTTTNIQPTAGLLFAVLLIAIGAIFLSQWLSSGRWSRGNFFFGTSALLIGGIQTYFSQLSPESISNSWALWIVAIGIALFGAAYIAVPRLPRLSIMGFVTIIAGAIGYILSSGSLDPSLIKFVGNLWFVGVAIIVFMMIAPLIRRRQ